MDFTLPFPIEWILTIGFIGMAILAIFIQLRATQRPIKTKRIMLTPLCLGAGFLMFLYPPTHIPLSWAVIAFTIGSIFLSYPLIRTTKFRITDNQIYLTRSKAFIFILLGLFLLRLLLRNYVEQYLTIEQTASIFFILAFGMIITWRISMYFRFQKVVKEKNSSQREVTS